MDLIEAVKARRSIRAFKTDPVPRDVLQELIDATRWCPSWENVQPWELAVVGGDKMEELRRELDAVADTEPAPEILVQHFNDPYLTRRRNLGYRIVFDTLKIEREDKERRKWWRLQNQSMFGAPGAIFISIDRSLNEWSIFDAGMIAQTLMLAAQHYGLGTIPQAAPIMYPGAIRKVTGIPDSKLLIVGLSLGYPDWSNPVNSFERDREPVEGFTSWCGFE
ncbi:MAG: nitroreductase [Dehalococcoidia bacterium]|nr:nitroreductase [Dehalococcoidia bacterium]